MMTTTTMTTARWQGMVEADERLVDGRTVEE